MKPYWLLAVSLAATAPAFAGQTPDPGLQQLKATLGAKLDAIESAERDAADPSHLAALVPDLQALTRTKSYADCIHKHWYHTRKHQQNACIALGEALKATSGKIESVMGPIDQEIAAARQELHDLSSTLSDADRAELAIQVSQQAGDAIDAADASLKSASDQILSSANADCSLSDLGASAKCAVDRAIRAFKQDIPAAESAALEVFMNDLADARARLASYAETLPSCGMAGTIAERVADCSTLADSVVRYQSPKSGVTFSWTRVTRTRSGHQLWRDEATGKIWTDVVGTVVSQSYGEMSCIAPELAPAEKAGLSVKFSLPTLDDYSTAYSHGLLTITGRAPVNFWTSTVEGQGLIGNMYYAFSTSASAWQDGDQDLRERITTLNEDLDKASARCVAGD